MPRTILSPPPRRRRSSLPIVLAILAVLLVAGLVYLSTTDTEVPQQRMEQDVTNEALAK